MTIRVTFNSEQRKGLSSFFNNLAVAWFVAAFITPTIEPEARLLTYITYIVNMIAALYISLYILKEEL